MFKNTLFLTAVLVALLMFTSDAKKSTSIRGNIFDSFEPKNESIVKDMLIKTDESVKVLVRRHMDSKAVFTHCPGPHETIYDIDDDYSHTEPELAKKNIDITLVLEGVMTVDTHVDQLHLDVYWNGNLFHTEDHKLDADVQEQEPYELKFTWFVPGFAPSGAYIVDLVVKSAGQELGCERVTFTL